MLTVNNLLRKMSFEENIKVEVHYTAGCICHIANGWNWCDLLPKEVRESEVLFFDIHKGRRIVIFA